MNERVVSQLQKNYLLEEPLKSMLVQFQKLELLMCLLLLMLLQLVM